MSLTSFPKMTSPAGCRTPLTVTLVQSMTTDWAPSHVRLPPSIISLVQLVKEDWLAQVKQPTNVDSVAHVSVGGQRVEDYGGSEKKS